MTSTCSTKTTALQVSTRAAMAAGLAVALSRLVRLQFPLYAMIAAILVTDLSPARTRQHGLPRLAGTMLGATVGAACCAALGQQSGSASLRLGLGILVAMLLSHVLRMKDAAKVAGYVCGVVLLNYSDSPWHYAVSRVCETVLGIGAAVAVSLVPKLLSVDEPDRQDSRG
ncbi:MAG: FUSC family protein [Pyrinomonadaceae bacterium]